MKSATSYFVHYISNIPIISHIPVSYFDQCQILPPARENSDPAFRPRKYFFSLKVAFFVYAVDRAESKTALRLTPR